MSEGSEAALAAYLAAKAEANRANAALYAAARLAAVALRIDDGLSVPAVGESLGVTPARVYQLLASVPEKTK